LKEEMTQTAVIDSPFATVEDTAKALGVSKTRLKRLVRLMATATPSSHGKIAARNDKSSVTLTRKREHAGGKVKKVAR
jgi:hypothetical protein